MANSYTGFFATLPVAADEATAALLPNTPFMYSVYTDFRSTPAAPFDTLNVSVPNSTYTVTNLANSGVNVSNLADSKVGIQLYEHPVVRFAVPDFDQARSPSDIRKVFLDEAIKKVYSYADAKLASLATTTNFNTYGQLTGSANAIPDAVMASGLINLAGQDVNVQDSMNMNLITTHNTYYNLVQTASWSQNLYLDQGAQDVRRTGQLGKQWGCVVDYDRQLPANRALLFHRYAIALVSAPLPEPQGNVIAAQNIKFRGFPIRVTLTWDQSLLAHTMSVDALFGYGVVRANHGQVIVT